MDGTNGLAGIYRRAELYETIYRGRGKDYAADSARVTALVREHHPSAASLLDVACGTGSHLRYFAKEFDHVEGVDLAADMVRLARRNLPGVPVHQGDMRDFRLDRTFDAITCMFSSIGYLRDADELTAALECFGRHLAPGGVIVLEPWWFPERALARHVVGDVVTVDGRTVSRVSHAVRRGAAHHMEVHYLVADPDAGIQHFTDTHVLALFEREQYEAAFARAGCRAEYLGPEETSPGLFVGVRTGEE